MAAVDIYVDEQWTLLAEGFAKDMKKELKEPILSAWKKILSKSLPQGKKLRILDIGCGTGYFATLLAQMGHKVTAIDSNEAMIRYGQLSVRNEIFDYPIEFLCMDTEKLDFGDASYDVVISRYVSWLLSNPEKAMREWYRVLNKEGVLINFDANWMMPFFDFNCGESFKKDQKELKLKGIKEESFYQDETAMEYMMNLPLSNIKRPDWDKEKLKEIGFIWIDSTWVRNQDIWNEYYKIAYRSVPTFMIRAFKGGENYEKE